MAMALTLRRYLERFIIAFLWLMPRKGMAHLLALLRNEPALSDRWGFHIRPMHYYEPLPDFRALRRENIEHRVNLHGIDFSISKQLNRIMVFGERYGGELSQLAQQNDPDGFAFDNDWFSSLDAALLYCIIRDRKPSKFIEVGSGFSTIIAAKALHRNWVEGVPSKHMCIDPYPPTHLHAHKLDVDLKVTTVQGCDIDIFQELSEGDILFVDSSHAVSCGSDVEFEFLRIYPLLSRGVYIHIHDIFFPTDYPADWIIGRRIAWNEQYLLQAFLMFNNHFVPRFAGRWLALDFEEEVRTAFPHACLGETIRSASFWMKRIN